MVSLITDSTMGVAARVDQANTAAGIVQPKVGEPGDLLLEYLPTDLNRISGDYSGDLGNDHHRR